jgi:hypothetical protein
MNGVEEEEAVPEAFPPAAAPSVEVGLAAPAAQCLPLRPQFQRRRRELLRMWT